jgi:hypothetical protein
MSQGKIDVTGGNRCHRGRSYMKSHPFLQPTKFFFLSLSISSDKFAKSEYGRHLKSLSLVTRPSVRFVMKIGY